MYKDQMEFVCFILTMLRCSLSYFVVLGHFTENILNRLRKISDPYNNVIKLLRGFSLSNKDFRVSY